MRISNSLFSFALLSMSASVMAAPMPHSIQIQDKAIVPVLKTEVIRRVAGEAPVRQVSATVLEMTNHGKDIVAREIELQDGQETFSEQQLSVPVVQKGSVIIPTSKIELSTTVKQDGEIISKSKKIDAEGMEFKKDAAPVKRTLQLDQRQDPKSSAKISHAVQTTNGTVTRDITVLSEGDDALPLE